MKWDVIESEFSKVLLNRVQSLNSSVLCSEWWKSIRTMFVLLECGITRKRKKNDVEFLISLFEWANQRFENDGITYLLF